MQVTTTEMKERVIHNRVDGTVLRQMRKSTLGKYSKQVQKLYTLGKPTGWPTATATPGAGGAGSWAGCAGATPVRAGGSTCWRSWKYSTIWPGSSASSWAVRLSTVSRCARG